jgi:hypothetical protein
MPEEPTATIERIEALAKSLHDALTELSTWNALVRLLAETPEASHWLSSLPATIELLEYEAAGGK